jgi:hypothetical protein
MQRFLSREPMAVLTPGASGQLADGRTFKVVDAAELANGRCEFLAVAPMVAGEAAGGGASDSAPAVAATAAGAAVIGGREAVGADGDTPTTSAPVVDAEALPMSYPLPE